MINISLTTISKIVGVENITSDEKITGISIDSRTIKSGNLFVAIKGDNFDGHDFISKAVENGAVGIIAEKKNAAVSFPQIMVKDAKIALGQIASYWRDQFKIPFIAVTGSNGKTTTKNMIANILKSYCESSSRDASISQVLVTKGNLNNYYGLPLTLFHLNVQHRFAVIEMGMSSFGEITYLSKITKPDIAVITNIAVAHQQNFKELKDIATAKSEIFDGFYKENSVAVLNADDAFFDYLKSRTTAKVISFGLKSSADIYATDIKEYEDKIEFQIKGLIDVSIQLPLPGVHNIKNALAAAAACFATGIDKNAIKIGLETVKSEKGRLNKKVLPSGAILIDDCYNANPASFKAAIDVLKQYHDRKKILVMGDMKELGKNENDLHREIGQYAKSAGIDVLFTFGDLAKLAAEAFGNGAKIYTSKEEIVADLKKVMQKNTVVLIKGSRSMKLEEIISKMIINP